MEGRGDAMTDKQLDKLADRVVAKVTESFPDVHSHELAVAMSHGAAKILANANRQTAFKPEATEP